MKKLFCTLFILLIMNGTVLAKNIPLYTTSINVEGMGIISLPQEFTVYEQADRKSPVLKNYKWGKAEGAYITEEYSDDFIIYDSLQNKAYMTVVDDSDKKGWYRVCYDQKNGLTGWVNPDNYIFYSWLSFYTRFGKANGLYAFNDLDNKQKWLYSKPDFDSQVINTFERAKDIRVQIFRGNWVLVRVYDYEGGMKIGWLNWRTKDGKFKYFPNVLK